MMCLLTHTGILILSLKTVCRILILFTVGPAIIIITHGCPLGAGEELVPGTIVRYGVTSGGHPGVLVLPGHGVRHMAGVGVTVHPGHGVRHMAGAGAGVLQ